VECGYVRVPKVKVVDRRKMSTGEIDPEGEIVKVVDVRWDQRATRESEGEDNRDVR
jgi:hypothetical protein